MTNRIPIANVSLWLVICMWQCKRQYVSIIFSIWLITWIRYHFIYNSWYLNLAHCHSHTHKNESVNWNKTIFVSLPMYRVVYMHAHYSAIINQKKKLVSKCMPNSQWWEKKIRQSIDPYISSHQNQQNCSVAALFVWCLSICRQDNTIGKHSSHVMDSHVCVCTNAMLVAFIRIYCNDIDTRTECYIFTQTK